MNLVRCFFILAIVTSTFHTGQGQQRVLLPEHKPLLFFVGTWQFTGTYNGEVFGPGKGHEIGESCDSIGGFFIVCRYRTITPEMSIKGVTVIGFNEHHSKYTLTTFDNLGNNDYYSTGTFSNGKWSWSDESGNSRWSWTQVSPTSYKILLESKSDNDVWKTYMEGLYNRVK